MLAEQSVAFQVVEFELDAQGNVLERRVVPYPYQGRQEAAAAKSIAGRYAEARYDQTNNFWCAVGNQGRPVRLAVEEIGNRSES